MDELLVEWGARYETAGALFGGEKVFMLAHFPKQAFTLNGKDSVEPYVAICNPHDGSGCAECFPTSVRIVCANTYRTAGRGAGKGLKIRHTGNIKHKIREARNALGMAVESFDHFEEAASSMAGKKLEAIPYFNGLLDSVLDVTEAQMKRGFNPLEAAMQTTQAEIDLQRKQFEAAAERRRDVLGDIINRYESGANAVGGMRGTAWSAFNAVTEHADHSRIGTRRVGTLDDQRSRRFENVLAGQADVIKQVAFEMALKT
jgi:phage/plasmid-like protein (TIGR03299 family)